MTASAPSAPDPVSVSPARRWGGARRPSAAQTLAIVLVGMQSLFLGAASRAWLLPIFILLSTGVVVFLPSRPRLSLRQQQLLALAIVLGVFSHYTIAPSSIPVESQFLFTPFSIAIAQCLLCFQVLTLFIHRAAPHPPLWLGGLGATCVAFAGNVRFSPAANPLLVLSVVAFVAVIAMYSLKARRPLSGGTGRRQATRSLLAALALILAVVLGGGTAIAFHRYERTIESILREYLAEGGRHAATGFTPSGRLNELLAWKTTDAEGVALRVFSKGEPGYLRGRVFDTFRTSQWEYSRQAWSVELPIRTLSPLHHERASISAEPQQFIYELGSGESQTLLRYDIFPEAHLGKYLFAPLNSCYLAIDDPRVTADAHLNLESEGRRYSTMYSVFVAARPGTTSLSEDLHTQFTQLDPELEAAVGDLAAGLFADCDSPRKKIDRVQHWFRTNFTYQLGARIPRGEDPLIYFLEERAPAHCEFFATGAAVLLRSAGVPCRYVAGYFVAEHNRVGDYWMARNKDAHAWVEAYDVDSDRWVIVEATPAAGVPAPLDHSWRSQAADSLQHDWRILLAQLRSLGIGGLLRMASQLVWSRTALLGIVLAATASLVWMLRSVRFPLFRKRDSRVLQLHAVLKQLDRRARPLGFVRAPGETILQFADRIRRTTTGPSGSALADSYQHYALLRFSDSTDHEQLLILRSVVPTSSDPHSYMASQTRSAGPHRPSGAAGA